MLNLGPSPSRFDPEQPQLSPERARVLEAMQRRDSAASVGDIARELNLHENTARKHLDGLVDRGLIARTTGVSVGRGRPARSYSALPRSTEPDARVREYVGLATALARHISTTSDDPRRDAIAAGETWGAELVQDPRGKHRGKGKTLLELLDRLGFSPEADATGDSIALRRCPLLDAVRAEPVVVCAVHLGIARGVVAALGEDPEPVRLEPFSEVGACRLHVA
ncbi:helix-turn-helix transcriptional regulator [Demequina lutea]|uniref:Putative ArsR family transcriptional regulator n=1 Tax=Demequina lutea TaxID=431489 RepID=A0A7Y9Z926_9MICO|nr:helix-turn-helix domain-containing protein [Demequina lutea]NYI41029.1 putative ArsR family transcriptional regulator [Demequina lutea]